MNSRCEIRTWSSLFRAPALRWAIVAAAAGCAAWVLFFLLDPAKQSFLPACLFHRFTGLYCPGCGATRALHRLAHGDWVAALRLNALVILGLPLGVLVVACRRGRSLPGWLLVALLACIVLFGVARNVPLFPFTMLAP